MSSYLSFRSPFLPASRAIKGERRMVRFPRDGRVEESDLKLMNNPEMENWGRRISRPAVLCSEIRLGKFDPAFLNINK